MTDTNIQNSALEAEHNFSEDAGETQTFDIASDEEILNLSKKLMEKNREAYEVLAK